MSASELEWKSYLLEHGIIEGYNGDKKRANILAFLRSLIPSFIRLCAKENNIKHNEFECQLLPFGSFGLGGHTKGGDIDVVLLAPTPIRRHDFLVLFPKLLRIQSSVFDVEVIPHSNVPIIKCIINSIHIDISFIRLQMATVPFDLDLLEDTFVHDMENTCLASANGPRVNQFILKHIYPNDMPVFRLAMQCIKHWANQRYIYNKPMGYLNGGAWTLLLVKTYFSKRSELGTVVTLADDDMFPRSASEPSTQSSVLSSSPSSSPPPSPYPLNTSPSVSTASSTHSSPTITASSLFSPPQTISFISLLRSFFSMWSTWPWPEPVLLTKSIPVIPEQSTSHTITIDNLADFQDSVLPIVTPCYPVGNASPFATQSTLAVMTKELHRAHKILEYHQFADPDAMKDKLFRPLNIVKEYKHFIKVTVSCDTAKSHDIWSRRMPTHLPMLVHLLESLHEINLARPYTRSFADVMSYRTQHEKFLLQNDYQRDAFDTAPLAPGTLFRRYYLIALEFNDSYKHTLVDMSDICEIFTKQMGDRKNKVNDVHVHLAAMKRRQVAMMMERHNLAVEECR